jgi:hypothetical protein
MNIRQTNDCRGSLITAAAVGAGVLSIIVAGILTLLSNEYSVNYRSHDWTQALHIAEGGVEVAFAEFTFPHFASNQGFQSSRGWYSNGPNSFYRSATLQNSAGRTIGYIYSYVYGVGTSTPYIDGYGYALRSARGSAGIWRRVRVVLANSSRFPVALVSKRTLDMNGNTVYMDSFDSSDSAKSNGGLYSFAKRQPNGDIASNDTIINSINVGNADIYGQVMTGPGGTVVMGSNGSVGPTFDSTQRARTVADGVNKGWVRNDFSVDIPNVSLPSGATSWTSVGSINNTRTLTGGDYQASSLALSGSSGTLFVTNGTVRLYITGNVNMNGNDQVVIAPNARLEVYVAGSVSLGGRGVVNQAGLAANNQWYGLPTSTSWSVNGNGYWIGTIYAPNASFTLSGGGSNGDMSGAVVADRITLNGTVQFHYDEALRSGQFSLGYLVASWQAYHWNGSTWVAD